jgi:nucleoside-diphosphate-sugar epimerase
VSKNIHIIGCGYIGKKIARRLLEKNTSPSCFVKTKNSQKQCVSAGINALCFDLDKPDVGLSVNNQSGFSHSRIAYLAPPPRSGNIDTRMQHFICMLETQSAPPEKIVLISTTGVYGDCAGEWVDEQRPVNPQADRAHRRLSAETQLIKFCEKFEVEFVVFRVPGIYAANKLPVKRIASGEPIVKAGDSGFTNRIHADDLTAFCVEALTEKNDSGIYNACDGNPSTMNDYFMKVADAMNLPRPEEISLQLAQQTLSKGMLSYLAESKRISNKKLLKNFNTRFKFPDLTTGLKTI